MSDDSQGGVEADCRLELTMKSGAKGVVEFSRTLESKELRHHSRQQRLGETSPSRLPELCMVHPTSSRFGTLLGPSNFPPLIHGLFEAIC